MNSIHHNLAIVALSMVVSTSVFAGNRSAAARLSPTVSSHAATAGTQPAHVTGQPNQSCGSASAPNTPGYAESAPGSAFNPTGVSGSMYAGQQPQNSRNTASVSQYDVACAHQP